METKQQNVRGRHTLARVPVGIHHAEHTRIDGNLSPNGKVRRGVGRHHVLHKPLTLQKDTVRDPAVLHAWLRYVHGVIREIVVEHALADAKVFQVGFRHGFLEEHVKTKHLSVELHPIGL